MTAKDYLSQAWRVDRVINAKLAQVRSLRELATRATATWSEIPVTGSRNFQRMEDIIAKILDLESEINADVLNLVDLKRDIVATVKAVADEDCRTLLELRYLAFQSWGEIAEDMRFSKDHIFTLHRKALSAVKLTVKGMEKQ